MLDVVCCVLVDLLAHLVLSSFLGCNQTLETNFCSHYFIIATYKNPPQVCCGFVFVFFRQEFKCTKQRFCLLLVQNSRRYNHVCYKGCGAMLSLNSKPGTGRKQTNLQVRHSHFYKHCTDFSFVSPVKQQSGTKIKLSVAHKKSFVKFFGGFFVYF